MKEESTIANRDRVDHQACSLLQYINVKVDILKIGNYFNELRWKIIRANNLLQFIHQVIIEFRFRKSLAQERFKSNLELRYQIIVSSIKFRKGFAKFMIYLHLSCKYLQSPLIITILLPEEKKEIIGTLEISARKAENRKIVATPGTRPEGYSSIRQ